MVDGKEVVVTDMDESLKIQNDARNMLKNANGDGEQRVQNLQKYQMSQTLSFHPKCLIKIIS